MIKFWRPRDPYGCFSNFSGHPILVDGKIYKTTEHYYQSKKIINPENQELVRKSKTAKECKNLAYTFPLREDWEKVKYEIMKEALRFKTLQHEDVKQILVSTGNEELAEDSPYDYVWGLGKDGSGTNWLGKAWMEIREELKNGVLQ
jgi:ribA/ribD-fused uncharacterized protein